jgi:hypothetical protein
MPLDIPRITGTNGFEARDGTGQVDAGSGVVVQVHLGVPKACGDRAVVIRIAIVASCGLLGLAAKFKSAPGVAHDRSMQQLLFDDLARYFGDRFAESRQACDR